MAFWKRKEEKIPPVAAPTLQSSRSNHSNSSTYVASRDGDPYSAPYSAPSSRSVSTAPTTSAPDPNRNELFSGYNAEKAGSGGRFFDGPPLPKEPVPGEEDDEDVEGIKQQTRFVKQESVNSTRNALRLAREAEETARNTLTRLGDQSGSLFNLFSCLHLWLTLLCDSEKLANTEQYLDVAKGHSARADDKTDELKKLNRSIFRPAITFNKDAKRAAQEAKLQERYNNEREERDKAMMDIRETQNRLGRAATYGRSENDDEESLVGPGAGRGRFKTEQQLAERKEQRKRYQFESTGSDDELEDELDGNLDEISSATKTLKALSMAMGQELGEQNSRIGRIEGKTSDVDQRLYRNTERVCLYFNIGITNH